MYNIMKHHGLIDTCINNGPHHLLEDLQDPYTLLIYVTLGDEDKYIPSQICRYSPVLPNELGQIHKFHPFHWFGVRWWWGVGLICKVHLPQPHLEVLGLHVRVEPCTVNHQMEDFRCHLCLRRYSVVSLECVDVGGNWPLQRGQVLLLI